MPGTAQGIVNLFIAEVARQQVLLEGLSQELGDVPNIEAAHQVEPMYFDRSDADIQRSGDFAIGMAQRHHSEDLALAGRNMQRRFGTVFHSVERKCGGVFVSCHLSSSLKFCDQSSKRQEMCKRNYGYLPRVQTRTDKTSPSWMSRSR